MIMEHFVGVWRLVSFETTLADGSTGYPYGQKPVGRLIYDRVGRMAVQIMDPGRPAFVSGNLGEGTPEEVKPAFDGCLAYFGTYAVNEQERFIVHKMLASLFPNWSGQELKRFYEFTGSRLVLTTPPFISAGKLVTGVLVWEKEED
jgi:hypothetical protein